MYIPNYPEDSTLRRHYESAAAFRRRARLAQPPSDSVLRRHYEQLTGVAAATPAPAPRAVLGPVPAPWPRPQRRHRPTVVDSSAG